MSMDVVKGGNDGLFDDGFGGIRGARGLLSTSDSARGGSVGGFRGGRGGDMGRRLEGGTAIDLAENGFVELAGLACIDTERERGWIGGAIGGDITRSGCGFGSKIGCSEF